MSEIVQEQDITKDIATFTTTDSNKQLRDDYFLNSGHQIKPFFEVDALDKDGKLIVPKEFAFNKIGHSMHDIDPVFTSLSFSSVIKTLLFKVMGFTDP